MRSASSPGLFTASDQGAGAQGAHACILPNPDAFGVFHPVLPKCEPRTSRHRQRCQRVGGKTLKVGKAFPVRKTITVVLKSWGEEHGARRRSCSKLLVPCLASCLRQYDEEPNEPTIAVAAHPCGPGLACGWSLDRLPGRTRRPNAAQPVLSERRHSILRAGPRVQTGPRS